MRKIFVFGSNLAGRHGAGAALFARQFHGAIYGQGRGLQGESYAIPTKDRDLAVRTLDEISRDVMEFLNFAEEHPEMLFDVTPIGCGLAGYQPEQIKPFFVDVPKNVNLPDVFK